MSDIIDDHNVYDNLDDHDDQYAPDNDDHAVHFAQDDLHGKHV